jgi:pSer/pThr/pTyr-binding forkhead associated (FHA) protein
MGKLVLKFDEQVLKEVPMGTAPVTIGRAPDNDICIDNLAISNYHARVYTDAGQLMVEDLKSMNGTFLNNSRVTRERLHSGDSILVGKHVILVDEKHDVAIFGKTRKAVAPKVDETFVLGTARQSAVLLQDLPASEHSEPVRARVPSLIVVKGKADQREYVLSVKLLVIGKSPMATVRLRGWFAPQVAAQINKRQDGYYLTGMAKRAPRVNGQPITHSTRLNDGDLIELRGLSLKFTYPG